VNVLVIVGDAMAPPPSPDRAGPEQPSPTDTSTLIVIGSGGAILSPSTKQALSSLVPNAVIVDGFGRVRDGAPWGSRVESSWLDGRRTSYPGFTLKRADDRARRSAPGRWFRALAPLGRLGPPGSHPPRLLQGRGQDGRATFVEVDGVRWVLSRPDMAKVEVDGTVVLLPVGGSESINTGGEKVYPEEVEGRPEESHPGRLPTPVGRRAYRDETLGASGWSPWSSPRRRRASDASNDIQSLGAGREWPAYKVPRQLSVVDKIPSIAQAARPTTAGPRDRACEPVRLTKGGMRLRRLFRSRLHFSCTPRHPPCTCT